MKIEIIFSVAQSLNFSVFYVNYSLLKLGNHRLANGRLVQLKCSDILKVILVDTQWD
jgi:hypothetical protein